MKSKQQAEAAPVDGQHTPGPWHIGRTITSGQEDIQLSGLTGDGRKKYDCFVVAPAYTVAGVGGIGKEECRANSRLIASAPALLEALKKCKAAVENGNLPPSARMELVRDYATPTIAAVEGRVAE